MGAVTIRAAWSPGEVRIAVEEDGVLIDYALWRPGTPDGVGDVYRGRITATVPAMAGAFVALAGPGELEGFLPDSEGAKGLTAGTIITVRVTRAAQGEKGPRLTARIASPDDGMSEGPAGLRRRGTDPMRELVARYPAARILMDNPALVATSRGDLGERITLVADAFDDAIEAEVEGLSGSELTLASGMRLSVCQTPALVAIDVDAGGSLAGRRASHFELNRTVLPELARQIRLRNLSGAIFIDLAGMKAKQRASLQPGLMAALAGDPLRPRFLGFTALGFAEIARPRVRAPLREAMLGPLASGLAGLRIIARTIRADPGRRLMLRAAPAVIAALEADAVALPELARITGQRLNSHSDPSLADNGWFVEGPNG